jgi:hypothetical protein
MDTPAIAPPPISSSVPRLRGVTMHRPATEPNDLERLFVERANAGDIEGLVALYELNATIACGDDVVAIGLNQIRQFLVRFLADRPQLGQSSQAPALHCGDLALTSSRSESGDVTAEIARRQPDGNWLWIIDQFTLAKLP